MAVPSWIKDSSVAAFNAPALLGPGEDLGRRAFPVKQYDYKGGMLTDGVVTKIEGAHLPGHVPSH
jgi:hypothetical protein